MLRSPRVYPLALLVALALLLAMPSAASAAGVREYQLQFAPAATGGGSLAIVTALIDPQATLPSAVTVPVPAGTTLLWAGEILGGDPAADPARTPTVERVGDMDLYTLTAEQSYTVQLEIQLPDPTVDGGRLKASMNWVNPGDEVLVTGAIIAEPGAEDVETKPAVAGEVQTNDAGENLYPLEGVRVPKDGAYAMTVEWKRPGATGGSAPPNTTLVVLVAALVVAAAALVAVLVRERAHARRAAIRQGREARRAAQDPVSGDDPSNTQAGDE